MRHLPWYWIVLFAALLGSSYLTYQHQERMKELEIQKSSATKP